MLRNSIQSTGLGVGLLTFAALVLRLATLDAHGFWTDEIASLDVVSLGFPTFVTQREGHLANQTPGHYLIVWLTSLLADPATTTVFGRLPSALAGALTVPVLYALGALLFGRAQGVIAAAMLVLSAAHLNYSQDLRPYSLMTLLTILSVYCLLRAAATGKAGWWAAFAAAAAANALNAYMAVTLAVPALVPLLGWVLLKKWRARGRDPHALRYGVLATGVMLAALAVSALDMLGSQRTPPDLSRLSVGAMVGSVQELLAWFGQFGVGGATERGLQLLVLLLAWAGLLVAVAHPRQGTRRYLGAAACALFMLVPPLLLAVFATSTAVFQRYALFAMPFYFLLVAHGLVALYRGREPGPGKAGARVVRGVALALAVVVAGAFVAGAYVYLHPDLHERVAFRQDFRGVAVYLSQHAGPDNTVVFLDDTGHGYTVTGFYWKGSPPVPAFDSRDPRLFAHEVRGDIYWVVSLENLDALDRLASADQGWGEAKAFERVRVLRESGSAGMTESMDRVVGKLEALLPGYQPVVTLRGCVLQGRGHVKEAAETYRRAGPFFPIGNIYLEAAEGYERLGREAFAWREALLAKYLEPYRPGVHEWLAAQLDDGQYAKESLAEEELARLLGQEAAR
ncbi:MAG TPA: glycosyltransferase family 39 protein [Chloroflexia bacterium]|nr:glycosyltransferase family 39 protein [Chloroflexia bacterium]